MHHAVKAILMKQGEGKVEKGKEIKRNKRA